MDADVQAFKDALTAKASAKDAALACVGAAKLAELNGKASEALWETVAAQGIDGAEGEAMQQAQQIADAYVAAHPEEFAAVQQYVNPQGHENIVRLIDAFRDAGMEEAVLKMTMFELVSFERQQIGVTPRATVRR